MSANRRSLIRFAEYATVSASVVGAIAMLTTQQPAYAIAPLSVASALNLVSRRQQVQQSEEHSAYLDQQVQTFASALQQIQQRLEIVGQQGLNRQRSLDALTQTVSEQAADLTAAVQQSAAAHDERLQQLDAARDELSQRWDAAHDELSQQLETARGEFPQRLDAVRNDLSQQLETARGELAQRLEVSRDEFLQQLETARGGLAQQQAVCDKLSQQLETVQDALTQQQQALAGLASLARVDDLSRTLQQTKALIDDEIEGIQATLNALSSQTEATLGQQQERLDQTQQRFEGQRAILAEQAPLLEGRFGDLYGDFEVLRRELEALALRVDGSSVIEPDDIDVPDFSQVVPQLPTGDDFDLDINLGIDFGTGYTKVCFRDLARDRSEVVTFAAPSSSGLTLDQTLMPTRLAILQDGTLLTGLTTAEWQQCDRPIRQEINYIKMRLAAIDLSQDFKGDEWRLERIAELDDDATVESLCAYYLSSVIARSQQWITQNRPELFTNQTVRWSVNIGVPVEYCDSPALERFERVLALAWLLKSTPVQTSTLTIATLNHLIAHLQQWMEHNKVRDALDCHTTPEIAAAVWSFLNSRQAQEGFYTFFDIGDGTLDGAAFIFKQASGERQVDFYIGQVEPLGVIAFVEKTATELDLSAESIRQSLSASDDSSDDNSDHNALQHKLQQSSARKRVQQMVATVVMEGNEKHQQVRQFLVKRDIGQNLKVFVGGGGGNTDFFQQAIRSTHSDFNQGNADIPPYELRQIPTPDDLSINGLDRKDFNRFAIAYGLCIPDGEGPTIQLPSQFDDIDPVTEIEIYEPEPYEDGRDAV